MLAPESQQVTASPNANTIFMVWKFKEGISQDALIEGFQNLCGLVINLNHTAANRYSSENASIVLGISHCAWLTLDLPKPLPQELVEFEEIRGPKHTAVSTPGDLHFHIRVSYTHLDVYKRQHIEGTVYSQPSSHTAHSPASMSEYAERTSSHAEAAAVSVTDTFVHRILGVPGALIGSIQVPDPRPLSQRLNTWHYWWQAHLLECIIDAGQRHLREGRITEAQEQLHRARSLLRGINVRNLGRYANDYFDDMAWLTLAVGRMNSFSIELTGANDVAAQDAGAALFEQLAKGFAPGGGMSWRKSKRCLLYTSCARPADRGRLRPRAHQR